MIIYIASLLSARARIFRGIYKDDVDRFGDPADSSESAVKASALPNWQVVLQAHAKDIVGGKKKPALSGGKECKADVFDDDEYIRNSQIYYLAQCSTLVYVYSRGDS